LRSTLVSALAACCERSFRTPVRRFLLGLSSDELQFIAGFLGSCILESMGEIRCSQSDFASRVASYQQACAGCSGGKYEDQNHKMILVREYLCRSGLRPEPSRVRAARA
jgi:hypothetical protein